MFFSQLVGLAFFSYSLDVRAVEAISYHLEVKTGNIAYSGTDAKIHLMIFGSGGNTGQLLLQSNYFDTDPFETGDINYINLEAADVGKVEGIKIIHDNTGSGPDWYLSTITISVPAQGMRYVFTPERWMETDKAKVQMDKPSSSEAISYHLEVKTGNIAYSGTDAKIYLIIFGSRGNIGPFELQSYYFVDTDPFETGDINNLNLKALDIGKVEGIKIIHDNTGSGPDWYLSTITISVPVQGMRYVFTPERWMETDKAKVQMDKPSSSEAISYHLEVKTGNIAYSGTDAKIYLMIFGSRGNIGHFELQSYYFVDTDPFETGDINNLNFKALDIGKVEGIKIIHDNTGSGPDWYLSTITISVPAQGIRYVFTPERWMETDKAKVQMDKPSSSEAISYHLEVKTGNIIYSGTDAKIYLMIFGSRGNIGTLELQSYYFFDSDPFETGDINNLNLKALDIGKVEGIKIIHDNTGSGPDWYLSTITISVPAQGMRYVFTPERWMETDKAKVQMDKPSSSEAISYHLELKTGNIIYSGTDAKIYLMIFGSRGNIGTFELQSYFDSDPFETGAVDNIILKAVDIGKIEGIKIIHDNTGSGPDWYLSTITISVPAAQGISYVFTFERWVEKDKAKVQMEKPICPFGWSANFNKCYKFVDEQLTATQAEIKCSSSYNGIIAPTKNKEQLDYVISLCDGTDVHIGANDIRTEGTYYWSDGTKTSWTNWASGQPSQVVGDDCVVAKGDKSWDSLQCTNKKYPVVCMVNNNKCTCKDEVKTTSDGYFVNTVVPVSTEAECNAKCSATTGCTLSMFFYGECELFFYLASKPTNSVDACQQFCTSTSGCKTFKYSGTTCTLYKRSFNRFVTNPNSAVMACVDPENLPCL